MGRGPGASGIWEGLKFWRLLRFLERNGIQREWGGFDLFSFDQTGRPMNLALSRTRLDGDTAGVGGVVDLSGYFDRTGGGGTPALDART